MPSEVFRERPRWVETGDAALPYRVETSSYTALMAGYLDAGAGDGLLWCVQLPQGHNLCYAPEFVAYVDHLLQVDIVAALPHVPAVVTGDTLTFDAGAFCATFTAQVDRLKLTIEIRAPFRDPDGDLVDQQTAMLTLSGGIVIPVELEVQDATGATRAGDWATAGDVRLYDPERQAVVQTLERVTAGDSGGHPGHGELRIVADVSGARRLYEGMPWQWLRVSGYPVVIDPTVVASSVTPSTATAYPNQRKIARFSNGVLFDMFNDGTNLVCRYSADSGATWQTPTIGATIHSNGGGISANGSVFITPDDRIFIAVGDNASFVRFYYGVPNADRTGYTWSARVDVGTSGYDLAPDIVAHAEGTGWKAHVVWSYLNGATSHVYRRSITITSGGSFSLDAGPYAVTAYWDGTGHKYPSIAIDSGKNLHVAYSHGKSGTNYGVRYARGTYSSGSWTWSADEAVTEPYFASGGNIVGAIDGSGRVVVAFVRNTTPYNIYVFRRGTAGGWADISPSASNSSYGSNQGLISLTIDQTNDDIYLFYAIASGTQYLTLYKYNGSWGAGVAVDTDTTVQKHPSARRETSGYAVDVLYTTGSSTYTVKHNRISLNTAPQQPANLSPNGQGRDASQAITLTATANDTAGDYPVAATWEIRENVSGSTTYYVQAGGTLTTATTWVPTPGNTMAITQQIAAGQLAQDKQFQWRVTTKDQGGLIGPASEWALLITSTPPTTTIVSPAAGSTITAASVTMQVSVSDAIGSVTYRVYADNAGAKGALLAEYANKATVLYTLPHDFAAQNGGGVWLAAAAVNADGVAGAETVQRYEVAFTPPPAPGFSVTAQHASGYNAVQFGSQDEADVSYNIVYRRAPGAEWITMATDVPVNGMYQDYTAVSGVTYEYQGDAVAPNAVATASLVATATLNLSRVWIHDVSDPEGTALQVRQVGDITPDWQPDITTNVYAGRTRPLADVGETDTAGYSTELLFLTRADYRQFETLVQRKGTVCVRDSIGLRTFGIVRGLTPAYSPAGHVRVTLDVTETDYSEEV